MSQNRLLELFSYHLHAQLHISKLKYSPLHHLEPNLLKIIITTHHKTLPHHTRTHPLALTLLLVFWELKGEDERDESFRANLLFHSLVSTEKIFSLICTKASLLIAFYHQGYFSYLIIFSSRLSLRGINYELFFALARSLSFQLPASPRARTKLKDISSLEVEFFSADAVPALPSSSREFLLQKSAKLKWKIRRNTRAEHG